MIEEIKRKFDEAEGGAINATDEQKDIWIGYLINGMDKANYLGRIVEANADNWKDSYGELHDQHEALKNEMNKWKSAYEKITETSLGMVENMENATKKIFELRRENEQLQEQLQKELKEVIEKKYEKS